MSGGRPVAVWPVLVVLAAILALVAILPPQWEPIARRSMVEERISTAWGDLSISPSEPLDEDEASVDQTPIAPAGCPKAAEAQSWLHAAAFPVLAAKPAAPPTPEVVLPDLPPDIGELSLEGPTVESEHRIARLSTPGATAAPDARDRQRDAFSGVTAESAPGFAIAEDNRRPAPGSIWCPPDSLFAQLNPLVESEQTAGWARETIAQVRRLGQAVDERPYEVPDVLAQLRAAVEEAEPVAETLADPAIATQLRRAGYSLRRRVDIWQRVLPPSSLAMRRQPVDLDRVRLALADVDAAIRDSEHGRRWREYLLIDALRQASDVAAGTEARRRTELARCVLGRVASSSLTEPQSRFLESEPLARFADELRRMAAAEPDPAALLAALERYEQTGESADARRLADECLWLGLRPDDPLYSDLQQHLAMHYRNANLRVELSESLLNRLMPERLPELERVRDTVLGNPVQGQSLTATDVAIRFQPDATRLRMALEISGEVAALTSSSSGPAVFQNSSESRYLARKPMELTVSGLSLEPAEVEEVSNVMRLRRLQTSFDGIPLIGAIIQNVARNQHDLHRGEARREVEQKVASRAKRRIDEEADARLGEMSQRLEERVLQPMHNLALGPRMVEAATTEDRMTMRLRVATARQLGAHTPRPKSPEDSLASFHVHQSAVNNFIEQLALGGKTFTVPELRAYLARRLEMPELDSGSTARNDVLITFAERDPLRVTCQDGRITLDLAIARLSKSPRAWNDFQVRVHYRPRVEGLSAELALDGVVELPGRRVQGRDQFALRGIFCKLFPKNKTQQLVPDRLREDSKLSDLAVTQMTIEDGWLALAVGPAPRVADRSAKDEGRRTK